MNPVKIGEYLYSAQAVNLWIEEDTLYVVDLDRGLEVFFVSNLALPEKIGHFYDTCEANDICIYNSYIFIADGMDNLEILQLVIETVPPPPPQQIFSSPLGVIST